MNTIKILQVRLDCVSKQEVLDRVKTAIKNHEKLEIFTVNNEFIVDAQKNKKFLEVLNSSDLNLIDSTGAAWAVQRHKIKTERIPGADLFLDICSLAADEGYRVFLLGGMTNAANKTKNKLMKIFPGIHVVGTNDRANITADAHNTELIDEINKSKADIVFVAFGAPKQEFWIRNNKDILNANVFMGVGGTFDYVSESIKRAPGWIRKIGLEWLYRFLRQPSRFKRIYKAVVTFPLMVVKHDKVKS